WSQSFAYDNGLVSAATDARGLTTYYAWDKLQRLTSIGFPDFTSIDNLYNRLDLAATRDRLGNWTYFGHNSSGQVTNITDARSNVTTLTYCSCSTIDKIAEPLGKTTQF